ncbi:MAG: sulfatase [Candidatus Aminicenantia bacterium]
MDKKEYFKNYISPSLLAGIIIGVIVSIILSIVLLSFYGRNFQELSFLNLLLYIIGKVGLFIVGFSFVFSILTFIFQKLFKKFLKIKKKFSFFLSFIFSLLFCFWVGFYINSNLLRYSREVKSYLIDLSILFFGVILFFIIYKIIPSVDSIERKRGLKYIVLILSVSFFLFTFRSNPFSLSYYVSKGDLSLKRNYDSQGKYLGSSRDISPKKLNIILFSIDTLRADGLSCYGNPRLTSPNIDSLSEEGILFRNVLAQSSWTLPSHMTMFTSLYPSVHGCNASPMWTKSIDSLNEYWITLPEILRSFGYSTVAFTDGKLLGPTFNFDQGFELCDDTGGGIKKISKKAIQWLENYSFQKPFFLFLHCYDVHHYKPPLNLERMFAENYKGKLLKFRKSGNSLEVRVTSNAYYHLSENDIKYLRALYDAEIYKTDREFGEVLTYLKRNNLYKDTIIIVTSDHGEEFWEHGGTGHGWSLHQHQLKVPLIMKCPTFSNSARKIEEWVGLIDIFPTILEILGIPIPNECQGISLIPLIEHGSYKKRSFLAEASHLGNQKCLIYKEHSFLFNQFSPIGENIFNWKRFIYIWRNIMHFSENELYNLVKDPYEKENIFSKEPKLAHEMRIMLLNQIKNNLAISTKNTLIKRIDMNKETKEHLKSLGYIK